VGLGNVGSGTLADSGRNAEQIAAKLGSAQSGGGLLPLGGREDHPRNRWAGAQTPDWREVIAHPDVDIVAELVGGTTVAAEIVEGAIAHRKSIVTPTRN